MSWGTFQVVGVGVTVVAGILHIRIQTQHLLVEVAASVVGPRPPAAASVVENLEMGELLSGTGRFVVAETLYMTAVEAQVGNLRDIVVSARSSAAAEGLEHMKHLD
jgi:hypothetical protein